MHKEDIDVLYSIIFSRVGWFFVFAFMGLGWAMVKHQNDKIEELSKENKVYRQKLGKD